MSASPVGTRQEHVRRDVGEPGKIPGRGERMSDNQQVERRLSVLDKFLTLWIFISMGVGIGIGYGWPALTKFIWSLQVGTTPIAVGILLCSFPVGMEEEVRGRAKHEKTEDGIEQAAGNIVGGEGAEDGAGDGACGKKPPGLVMNSPHPVVCPGARSGVEKDDRQGDACEERGAIGGIDQQKDGHQDKAAAGSYQRAAGADSKTDCDQPQVLYHESRPFK